MSDVLDELIGLLDLEPIGVNRFRGRCQDLGFKNLFGGQVLGQALSAATQTLPGDIHRDWLPHSLHSYFLRPGNVKDSLEFEVSVLRDGRSFANRQVLVSQLGKAVMTMTCSFQRPEAGLEHQVAKPAAEGPEGIASQVELARQWRDCFPERLRPIYTADKPVEMRVVDPVNIFSPEVRPPHKTVWMRSDDTMDDSIRHHTTLLAYASDFNLITTALLPHGVTVFQKEMQVASLDHSIWFHRRFRMDDWLLYSIDSPTASGGRGFCRGQVFSADGKLVASIAQEGLIRHCQPED
ncbi:MULTISPECIES: acyl-CoA thioesterase II [unclassified Oceanobacter]|uniref:acyl-CoA thioesterase n=1 Tax=unclassified Oceanobacter TaxID=2620260 RepID=UPI002736942A|nr:MULTISPECIES: acyl-CoA thioesterase II [unclassified Oceanobacter]MDP2548690.1 acyl-CoA thioesterase II [Oceanobacter sp. 4_MG-2023]MDP2609254.1 acyl-CoA thioesterase II [Oceanobacter sp. 1_MG-2023]MDP2612649.1 acyl-CoA thioesterase II [Oceanobacter sp. 2_MG-2023]